MSPKTTDCTATLLTFAQIQRDPSMRLNVSRAFVSLQDHFVSALTVVFVNSKSLSSIKIDDTPVDDPSLKVLVANNSDTLKLLKMSSCPHVSPAGTVLHERLLVFQVAL